MFVLFESIYKCFRYLDNNVIAHLIFISVYWKDCRCVMHVSEKFELTWQSIKLNFSKTCTCNVIQVFHLWSWSSHCPSTRRTTTGPLTQECMWHLSLSPFVRACVCVCVCACEPACVPACVCVFRLSSFSSLPWPNLTFGFKSVVADVILSLLSERQELSHCRATLTAFLNSTLSLRNNRTVW